jgi:hypothetical protein
MLRATAEDRESLASGAKTWYGAWWRRCFGEIRQAHLRLEAARYEPNLVDYTQYDHGAGHL